MGVFIRSTVKNAARLAVYDEIIIKVKNHQTLPTILPEIALEMEWYIQVKRQQDIYKLRDS